MEYKFQIFYSTYYSSNLEMIIFAPSKKEAIKIFHSYFLPDDKEQIKRIIITPIINNNFN